MGGIDVDSANGGVKDLNNFFFAVMVAVTLAVLLNLSGLSMIIYGIVVMASDCWIDKSWVLLLYGCLTVLTYIWPLLAGLDWHYASRDNRPPNKILKALSFLGYCDGAYTGWCASEILKNYSES